MSTKLKKWYVEYKYFDLALDKYQSDCIENIEAESEVEACALAEYTVAGMLAVTKTPFYRIECKAYPVHR